MDPSFAHLARQQHLTFDVVKLILVTKNLRHKKMPDRHNKLKFNCEMVVKIALAIKNRLSFTRQQKYFQNAGTAKVQFQWRGVAIPTSS